ncbi:glycosyltransferase, family 2 [Campylobacter mucosalis]|uniref:glycosyltransferase family 2 protein n=1 Tax=Campylobacter mucosalis TaxID=202 RepID=UPI0006894004|nr:glycosyltransferase family 2 protein [Campylobacter mucosalis]QKF63251.1 glycosyltransferase, family 2 [Campylobacter mucosalis]
MQILDYEVGMKKYDVSIIVPIYNVENFIEKCATSLMKQDYESIEFIFVNDCTLDKSMEVLSQTLNKYPNRKDDIKIINKPQNEGLPQARKTGFENSNGEFVLHIDSDDWIEPNMVSKMYQKANDNNADIVCCDYFLNYHNKQVYRSHNYIGANFSDFKRNDYIKSILAMYVSVALWDKLIARKLYKDVIFPTSSHGEDTILCLQLFLNANKILHLNEAFVHYNRTNSNSLSTRNFSKQEIESFKLFSSFITNFIYKNNLSDCIKYQYIGFLNIFIPNNTSNTKLYIKEILPQSYKVKYVWMNKKNSFVRKILYSLVFIRLDFLIAFSKKFYRYIKNL